MSHITCPEFRTEVTEITEQGNVVPLDATLAKIFSNE